MGGECGGVMEANGAGANRGENVGEGGLLEAWLEHADRAGDGGVPSIGEGGVAPSGGEPESEE